MIVYYVVLLCCFFLVFFAEKNDYSSNNNLSDGIVSHTHNCRNLFIIMAIVLIIVSGFRYGVGADYWSYYRGGERYSKMLTESIKSLDEPGMKLLYWIVRKFTLENIVPIFVFAAITISMMVTVIYRHTDRLLLAVLFFLFLGCWHESFNAVRQCLAAAIVFSGYRFLQEKKFAKYVLVVFIAFLFHRTAIVMIAPYFVYRMRVSVRNIFFLAVGVAIVLYSYDQIFSLTEWVLQDSLANDAKYAYRQINPLRVIIAVAPALYYLFTSNGRERDDTEQFYLDILIVHAVVMLVASQSAMLGRFGIYTAPFCAIAIPELDKMEISKSKINNMHLICILYLAYWIYDIAKDATLNPYVWYWH